MSDLEQIIQAVKLHCDSLRKDMQEMHKLLTIKLSLAGVIVLSLGLLMAFHKF